MGYDQVGITIMDTPYSFAIRGAHLAAIALWRTVDPVFGVDIRTYAHVILAWAAFTTAASLFSRFISIRRISALHATMSIESIKREAYLRSGRQFVHGDEAPPGCVIDSMLKVASDREMAQMSFLPLCAVIGAVLFAVGICTSAVYALRILGKPLVYPAALAEVLGGFVIVAAGLVGSVATRQSQSTEYFSIP